MKPILNIKIKVRDPLDPTSLSDAGVVEVTAVGEVTVILSRDQMGVVKVESSEVTAEPGWMEQLKEAQLTFKELHEQLGRTALAAQYANTDLFAIHKWLTR